MRAAKPRTASAFSATRRQTAECAASQSSHCGASVSKVALPVAMPSRYTARTADQSAGAMGRIEKSISTTVDDSGEAGEGNQCSVHELTGQVESYGPSAFIGVHRRLMNCFRELSR